MIRKGNVAYRRGEVFGDDAFSVYFKRPYSFGEKVQREYLNDCTVPQGVFAPPRYVTRRRKFGRRRARWGAWR